MTFASLAVYFFFGLAWIRLPGPQHDEVIFLNAALPASIRVSTLANLEILGFDIPTMLLSYVGALKGWLWWAMFVVWPPSIYSVRVPAVLLGGLALVLFYLWVRKWYSPGVGLLALALAAADPSYIYTARLDWGPVVLDHLLMFSGLLLGTAWLERESAPGQDGTCRRFVPLGGAGLCFGLALWHKTTFVWFLAALPVPLLVLFPKQTARYLRPVAAFVFVVSLLIGALPLVLYNFETGGGEKTVSRVRVEELTAQTIIRKVENLKRSLRGDAAYWWIGDDVDPSVSELHPDMAGAVLDFLSGYSQAFPNPFPHLLLLGLAAVLLLRCHRSKLLFPFLIAGLMWLQMMIAKDGGSSVHHYALSYPFPHLALAAVAWRIWSLRNRWSRRVVVAAIAAVLLAQLSWDARYLRMFCETGGARFWTDAIYEIADLLQQQQPQPLVIMDWGFSNPILLLGHGRVPIYEDYTGENVPRLAELFRQPNVLFLIHAEGQEAFPGGRKLLDDIAPQQNAECRTVKNFFQKDGRMVARMLKCTTAREPASLAGALLGQRP